MKEHENLGIPITKETKNWLLKFIRTFERQNKFDEEKIEKFRNETKRLGSIAAKAGAANDTTYPYLLDVMDNIKRIIDEQKKVADKIRNFTERI